MLQTFSIFTIKVKSQVLQLHLLWREVPGPQGNFPWVLLTKALPILGGRRTKGYRSALPRIFQGMTLPSWLKCAVNRSTLQAVFTILAVDPPNKDILTQPRFGPTL